MNKTALFPIIFHKKSMFVWFDFGRVNLTASCMLGKHFCTDSRTQLKNKIIFIQEVLV
jgi:hypothetical protein